jgi:hypothetical protein
VGTISSVSTISSCIVPPPFLSEVRFALIITEPSVRPQDKIDVDRLCRYREPANPLPRRRRHTYRAISPSPPTLTKEVQMALEVLDTVEVLPTCHA